MWGLWSHSIWVCQYPKEEKANTISWSDGDSKDCQYEEEDHVNNIALARFLSTNAYSCAQKKTTGVAIEIVHYYNNTVLVDDVATSKK